MTSRYLGTFVLVLLVLASCSQSAPAPEKPLHIGVMTALSGPAAAYGLAFEAGLRKAVEEINQNGTKIKLTFEDNLNDPKKGVESYNALRLQDPDVVISSFSGASVAVTPLVKADGKPLFGSLTTAPFNTEYDNSFRYFFSGDDNAKTLLPFLQERNITKVGLFYTNSEAAIAATKPVRDLLIANGIEVVGEEAYDPAVLDHRTSVLKLAAKKPEAIYVWAIRPDQVVASLKDGYDGMILFNEIPINGRFYLNGEAFDSTYGMAMSFAIPGTPEYEAFTQKFGETQNGYASFGYDLAYLIWENSQHGTDVANVISRTIASPTHTGMVGTIPVDQVKRQTSVPMQVLYINGSQLQTPQ